MSNEGTVKAIAYGLLDGGLDFSTNYPGFFSQDIFELINTENKKISLNERSAFAESFGASQAGKRAATMFKNVGLNVAADAYLHGHISGVNAGMVVVVTDDINVTGSQERQDSRHYIDFFGGLWLEPNDAQEAYTFARLSFSLSERFDVPVTIRLTNNSLADKSGAFKREAKLSYDFEPSNDPSKFIVHPYYYKQQSISLKTKKTKIAKFVEEFSNIPKTTHKHGLIVIGSAEAEDAAQTKQRDHDIFYVSTYPLPKRAIEDFVRDHEQVEMVEKGDDYAYAQICSFNIDRSKIEKRIKEEKFKRFEKWSGYSELFSGLKEASPEFVVSDITQFTVEETGVVNTSLSLGTAVSVGIGFAEASKKPTFVLCGDCSFLHEGSDIVRYAVDKKISLKIVILENGGAWCTGGQENPVDLHGSIGIEEKVINLGEFDRRQFKKIFSDMSKKSYVQVLFIKTPMQDPRRGS